MKSIRSKVPDTEYKGANSLLSPFYQEFTGGTLDLKAVWLEVGQWLISIGVDSASSQTLYGMRGLVHTIICVRNPEMNTNEYVSKFNVATGNFPKEIKAR